MAVPANRSARAPGTHVEMRASTVKVPDFFIVGHHKSGTTALYEMLRSHPGIFMPQLKEPLFFARELHPELEPGDPQPNTLDEYLELFAPATDGQQLGEASPSYLASRTAASRIAEVAPGARIIAILREPASFLRSLHLELLKDQLETEKDFGKAIAREQREPETRPVPWYSSERVGYTEQLRRYHAAFGLEQVLVLIYDDFRADNDATVRRVLRFLEVDEATPLSSSDANRAVFVRSPRAFQFLRSLYLGDGAVTRVLKPTIKALSSQRLRRSGLRTLRDRVLFAEPPEVDQQLTIELRHRFRPEVEALSEYLGRDLVALWGYDKLG